MDLFDRKIVRAGSVFIVVCIFLGVIFSQWQRRLVQEADGYNGETADCLETEFFAKGADFPFQECVDYVVVPDWEVEISEIIPPRYEGGRSFLLTAKRRGSFPNATLSDELHLEPPSQHNIDMDVGPYLQARAYEYTGLATLCSPRPPVPPTRDGWWRHEMQWGDDGSLLIVTAIGIHPFTQGQVWQMKAYRDKDRGCWTVGFLERIQR